MMKRETETRGMKSKDTENGGRGETLLYCYMLLNAGEKKDKRNNKKKRKNTKNKKKNMERKKERKKGRKKKAFFIRRLLGLR